MALNYFKFYYVITWHCIMVRWEIYIDNFLFRHHWHLRFLTWMVEKPKFPFLSFSPFKCHMSYCNIHFFGHILKLGFNTINCFFFLTAFASFGKWWARWWRRGAIRLMKKVTGCLFFKVLFSPVFELRYKVLLGKSLVICAFSLK